MAKEFYGRCNCKKRSPGGAKSSFLQEADAVKVNANAASELISAYYRARKQKHPAQELT